MNVKRLVSDCILDGARVYGCGFHVVLCMCVEYMERLRNSLFMFTIITNFSFAYSGGS